MATKATLGDRVLKHLTVIDHIRNPSAEEQATIEEVIDDVSAELTEMGLCWWDENDIPAAAVGPMRDLVSARGCGAFGKRGKGFESAEPAAMRRLQALKNTNEHPTIKALYY